MNILLETFGIITTILAIVGVYFNNRLNRKCFYFWIVSNAISCVLHLYTGLWSLALRDAVFLAMAFEGLRKWSEEKYLTEKYWDSLSSVSSVPSVARNKGPLNAQ